MTGTRVAAEPADFSVTRLRPCLAAATLLAVCAAQAKQVDLTGPPGSGRFGATVAVLPNGNIVVGDPGASNGMPFHGGAVYLYDPKGNLISQLSGGTDLDYVGEFISVLPDGNFVVISPSWHNGSVANAGAVTLVDGELGLSATVSPENSLVGTQSDDEVGSGGVVPVGNNNFAVVSANWNHNAGAVTWVDGRSGLIGPVTESNSLIGSVAGDHVGSTDYGVTPLANGNYVVGSPDWHDRASSVGAATWADGNRGLSGYVSLANSLVGSTDGDSVGFSVAALSNGNYVVASPNWTDGAIEHVGAATWADGSTGLTGRVSEANSLVGSTPNDYVAAGCACTWERTITPLSNGNYVVRSSEWNNGTALRAGAATWGDGFTGLVGVVSSANSLVGSKQDDRIGHAGATALTNGNYVVVSDEWGGESGMRFGAATWGNGKTGTVGIVSEQNSLTGTGENDGIGSGGVIALSNGNYVVGSPDWSNPQTSGSLHNGAATWGNGDLGTIGLVSAQNSLIGTSNDDQVGFVTALANGDYVVTSPNWSDARGAVTWADGIGPQSGTVSAQNSLVGTSSDEYVGGGGISAYTDGSFIAWSAWVQSGRGAITYSSGGSIIGAVTPQNSIIGGVSGVGNTLTYANSTDHHVLVVGRPVENVVTLWDTDALFADGFDND